MISVRQLAGALHGIGLLLRFDGRAWEFFDKSPGGFWASFLVAAVVAPLHFAHVFLQYRNNTPDLGPLSTTIIQALAYILTWTIFPFAMLYAARFLGREQRYFWHLVPYNWFQLPVAVPLSVLTLLADLALIPQQAFGFIYLLALAVIAIYSTFIAAAGLHIPTGTAMSLVVMDFALTFLAGELIGRI